MLFRLGLCGVLDDEAMLGPDEWRLGELGRKLRVHPSKLRRWVRRGWIQGRFPSALKAYIVWADRDEVERLKRLRDQVKAHPHGPHPEELTTPKSRDTKRQRPTEP
jgi:hypothetical protein